jgi:hypothetical protein
MDLATQSDAVNWVDSAQYFRRLAANDATDSLLMRAAAEVGDHALQLKLLLEQPDCSVKVEQLEQLGDQFGDLQRTEL